jgi:ATP/maltotriose-dependent transcriptional regulator MalT
MPRQPYFVPLVLVLENYHLIEAAAVHTIVQLMLDYVPFSVSIRVIDREPSSRSPVFSP